MFRWWNSLDSECGFVLLVSGCSCWASGQERVQWRVDSSRWVKQTLSQSILAEKLQGFCNDPVCPESSLFGFGRYKTPEDVTPVIISMIVWFLCSYWTDFVLVWEEPLSSQNEENTGVNPAHRKWREKFLKKLKLSGLLLEQVSKTNTPEENRWSQTETTNRRVLLSVPQISCLYISYFVTLQDYCH